MTEQGKAMLADGLVLKPHDTNAVCRTIQNELCSGGFNGEPHVYGDIIFVELWQERRTKIYRQRTSTNKVSSTGKTYTHKTFTKLGEIKSVKNGMVGTRFFKDLPNDYKFCDHHHVLKHYFGFEDAHPWTKE